MAVGRAIVHSSEATTRIPLHFLGPGETFNKRLETFSDLVPNRKEGFAKKNWCGMWGVRNSGFLEGQ